jgi:hypothetical protein
LDVDRFNNFWAAKILIRFTPAQLKAAIKHGRFTDPKANEYILHVLIERQRKAARYFFRQVDPLDHFELATRAGATELCFDDLALRYGLEDAPSSYAASVHDYEGERQDWQGNAEPDARGRACLRGFPVQSAKDGYTMLKIRTARSGLKGRGTVVHMAKDSAGMLQVIGLRRL